jgi:hypothetical protein
VTTSPYLVVGGAVVATWLLERGLDGSTGPASSAIPFTREAGLDQGLATAAAGRPCGIERLGSTKTLTGAEIMRLPSGSGADFIREYCIERICLTKALGDIAIPGLTNRPKLSARCAAAWCEQWLDAWQVANRTNPRAFALDHGRIAGGVLAPLTLAFDPAPAWRSIDSVDNPSDIGKAFMRVLKLHSFATIDATTPLADVRPWIQARETAEALMDFARELDGGGFSHDTGWEALADLKHDLSPTRVLEKAAGAAAAPLEIALRDLVGPVLAAAVGVIVSAALPLLVVGGVVYYVTKRGIP